MSSFEKNLSEGNVAKQLILFSLPFLASNIIQSLYSVADMLIVGRFSGTTSMSGVNLGSQVTLILTNIVVGLKQAGCEVVFPTCYTQDAKLLFNTMKSMNYSPLIIGGGGGFLYHHLVKNLVNW